MRIFCFLLVLFFFEEVEVEKKVRRKLNFFSFKKTKKNIRTYDSFFPKNGDVLTPDLTKNVGSLPLGLTVAENIFQAGNGLAPKFVGTPVPLPPAPASSAEVTTVLSPIEIVEGGLSGVSRAPASAGTAYEPLPGIGEVSDLFIRAKA